jgi:WD repeat-containing protein 68
MRLFDLRQLQHSTILYETLTKTQKSSPLARLSFNKLDDNYIATFAESSKTVVILDKRVPAIPVIELKQHVENISSVCWAPYSSSHIVTGGFWF